MLPRRGYKVYDKESPVYSDDDSNDSEDGVEDYGSSSFRVSSGTTSKQSRRQMEFESDED